MTARYPTVVLSLDAHERADVLVLSALAADAMRRAGVPLDDVTAYLVETFNVLDDAGEALRIARRWLTVVVVERRVDGAG